MALLHNPTLGFVYVFCVLLDSCIGTMNLFNAQFFIFVCSGYYTEEFCSYFLPQLGHPTTKNVQEI